MSLNLAQPYELVEYTLGHESLTEPIVIEEPIGWKDDLMELKRSDKNFTTVTKYSTNLEFFGDGADIIRQIYANYGLEAQIVLRKKIVHPTKQEVITRYIAFLDGYTFSQKNGKIKVNAVESDLTGKIKGYQSEKVEVIRETAIDGTEIGALNTELVNIIGKDILLVSKFGVRLGDEKLLTPHSGSDTEFYTTFPMDLYADSHVDAADVTNYKIQNQNNGLPFNGSTQNMLWSVSEETVTIDQFVIDVELEYTMPNDINGIRLFYGNMYLLIFEDVSNTGGSTQYKYKRRIPLVSALNPDGGQNDSNMTRKTITYKNTFADFEILKGESVALAVSQKSFFGEDVELEMKKIDVQIISNSYEEGTQCECILPFELMERLIRIMSGRTDQVLQSDYFGRKELGYLEDGPGAYIGVTSGFLARGFRDKPLTTSFKDAMESYGTVLNVSYVVEKIGFKEVVRIEPTDYFFNNKKTFLERTVSTKELELKVSTEFSIKGIELGYEKGGEEYEEAVGLDEFNGKSNWVTPLSGAETQYMKLSTYRADCTGLVFAIRKLVKSFPTEDTSYDKDIFLLDMKPGQYGIYEQRVWQDDYSTVPTGLYSPKTATNLRLSPIEIFKRHEPYFGACLQGYKDKTITFGSGVGNVLFTLEGEIANRDIPIASIQRSSFKNFWLSFNYSTNFEEETEMTDNIYGIFEFNDSEGKTWQFRLFEFKKNKYKGLLINGIQ